MKKNKIIFALCFFIISVMAFTGCRPDERPVPRPVPDRQRVEDEVQPRPDIDVPNDQRNLRPVPPEPNARDLDAPERVDQTRAEQEIIRRADRIADGIAEMKEVRSATVVISGNTALVGVTLEDNIRGEMNREVERKIIDRAKQIDEATDRVVVTADPDLFRRIENIAREAGRGRPLTGFGQEIEELIRKITPAM